MGRRLRRAYNAGRSGRNCEQAGRAVRLAFAPLPACPRLRKSGTQRLGMLATFNKIMNLCLVAAFSVMLIGVIRTRWTKRYDIKPSEIHPDLEAGEELLRDALKEDAHRDTETAIDDEPR